MKVVINVENNIIIKRAVEEVFAAGAVLRTADRGKTWRGHLKGALRDCHTLVFHANNGDWVYQAGGSDAGAAYSRDGRVTWNQPKAGLDRHYRWASATDPINLTSIHRSLIML
jgi:septum formation inhibitor-activating ATPase MinD